MKTKIECDICLNEWDKEFFCDKCSNKVYLVEEEVPDLFYDGDIRKTGFKMEMVEQFSGDVCFNCCKGHAKVVGL